VRARKACTASARASVAGASGEVAASIKPLRGERGDELRSGLAALAARILERARIEESQPRARLQVAAGPPAAQRRQVVRRPGDEGAR
jgi:hypothetical protein